MPIIGIISGCIIFGAASFGLGFLAGSEYGRRIGIGLGFISGSEFGYQNAMREMLHVVRHGEGVMPKFDASGEVPK
jgi:hypothetical protein